MKFPKVSREVWRRAHARAVAHVEAERRVFGSAFERVAALEEGASIERGLGIDGRLSDVRKTRLARIAVMKRFGVRTWGGVERAVRTYDDQALVRFYGRRPEPRSSSPTPKPMGRATPPADHRSYATPGGEVVTVESLAARILAGVSVESMREQIEALSPSEADRLALLTGLVIKLDWSGGDPLGPLDLAASRWRMN
ncbi:MAG TPA: hypothetical protein VJX91_00145 [Candidatus Eisenbacteria bacterium]|nr:hypothetical protein [Candidatus Eisenbacteria bacterium]